MDNSASFESYDADSDVAYQLSRQIRILAVRAQAGEVEQSILEELYSLAIRSDQLLGVMPTQRSTQYYSDVDLLQAEVLRIGNQLAEASLSSVTDANYSAQFERINRAREEIRKGTGSSSEDIAAAIQVATERLDELKAKPIDSAISIAEFKTQAKRAMAELEDLRTQLAEVESRETRAFFLP
jgi:hypothetical protein